MKITPFRQIVGNCGVEVTLGLQTLQFRTADYPQPARNRCYCPNRWYSSGVAALAAGRAAGGAGAAKAPLIIESVVAGERSGECAGGGTDSSLAEAPASGSGFSG